MPYPASNYNPATNYNGWQYPQPSPTYRQQPVNNLIRVTGIEGAKAYQLPPNSDAVLFDGNDAVFYVKTTDGAGFPTIRKFVFEESSIETVSQDTTQFISRNEFNDAIEKLMGRIDQYAQSNISESNEFSNGKQQHIQSNRQSKGRSDGQS